MKSISNIVAGLVVGLGLGTTAQGQNALGDGTALDANISTVGRSNLPTEAIDFNLNNLLITNNVVGGRGFRGTVGYSAANDFRDEDGTVGSDEFFQFRANSALSDINLLNLGTTYQRLRYGQGLGLIGYHRASEGFVFPDPSTSAAAESRSATIANLRRDQISFSSQISSEILRAEEPQNVGVMRDEERNAYVISASPLSGLQTTDARVTTGLVGLSEYDAARLRDDLIDRRTMHLPGQPFEARFTDLQAIREAIAERGDQADRHLPGDRQDTRADSFAQTQTSLESNRLQTLINRDYAQIMEKIVENQEQFDFEMTTGAADEEVDDSGIEYTDTEKLLGLQDDIRRLRTELEGDASNSPEPHDPTQLPGRNPTQPSIPGVQLPGMSDTDDESSEGSSLPGSNIPGVSSSTGVPGHVPDVNSSTTVRIPKSDVPEQFKDEFGGRDGDPYQEIIKQNENSSHLNRMGSILRHGQRIEHFTDESDSRFGELMASGEEALRSGDYFFAERRFDRALRFVAGHPLATAGKAHAQLGAQLYIPASITLQSLFEHQPEMIDVEYDESLIPNRPRLLDSVATLEARLDLPRDRAHNAFLLAYIGHLIDDRAIIEKGIRIFIEERPDDTMPALLEAIWLAPDSSDAASESPIEPVNEVEVETPEK